MKITQEDLNAKILEEINLGNLPIVMRSLEFGSEVIITNSLNYQYSIRFEGCLFQKLFIEKDDGNENKTIISGGVIKTLVLEGRANVELENIETEISLIEANSYKLDVKNSKIDRVDTSVGGSFLKFHESSINSFIEGKKNSYLQFHYCRVGQLKVQNLSESLRISHCYEIEKIELRIVSKKKNLLKISDSGFKTENAGSMMIIKADSLLGVEFNNLNLSHTFLSLNAKDFEFDYHNVLWPNRYEYYLGDDISKIQLQTIFRRLKKNCEKDNDHIQARIFSSLEMEAYYKNLIVEKSFPRIVDWPLAVSYHSNRFGRNWVLPLYWALIFSIIFYEISILILFDANQAGSRYDAWVQLNRQGVFFQYILPTHSFSLFDKFSTPAWLFVVDAVQRVFSGFFIFQFIRAFRFHVAR